MYFKISKKKTKNKKNKVHLLVQDKVYHLTSTRHSSRDRSPILALGGTLSFLDGEQAQSRSSTSSEKKLSLLSRATITIINNIRF